MKNHHQNSVENPLEHIHKKTLESHIDFEQRYRSLFDRSFFCVYLLDFEGNVLDANDAALNLLGYTREEIPLYNISSLVIEEQVPFAFQIIEEIKQNGTQRSPVEISLRKKNGEHVWLEVEGALIYRDGKPYAIQGIALDITARKITEEKFRTLVENANEAIIVAQEGILKFANPKTSAVTGYSTEELTSKPFLEFIHPDDRALILERHKHRIDGKEIPEIYPFRIFDKERNVKWVEINAVKIDWEDKPATLNFLTEITERKQAEERLLIKKQAIESAINAIAFADLDTNLTYVNNAFLRLWGYTDETEVLGRPALDFWQTEEEALQVIESLYENDRGSWIGELTARRKDGSLFDAQISASLVRDENEKPVCIMGSFIDITKRKQTEKSLRERERDLEIKTKNLEEMNAALNVLLKKREEDKIELEKKVLLNIKQLIEPYISKLKKSGLDESQKALTVILESNLKDITSSFTFSLSSPHLNMTPKEIKVANLIKQGKTSKEICEILGSSEKVVAFHRQNIRRRLGLLNKKVNLKSYLMTKF